MTISIIAAIGKNNELGKKNTLLWDLPADMKHFKKTTSGHAVIMGQKTYESIGKPLPNRRNMVLTLDKSYSSQDVDIFYSIPEIMKELEKITEEVFIIGGGQIYKLFIEKAEKLYITHVNADFPDADTFFPVIDKQKWHKIKDVKYPKDKTNRYDLNFTEYVKN